MLTAVWIALAVGVAGFIAGLAYAVSHGFRMWRTFRRTSRHLTQGVADLTDKATAVEEKAAAAMSNSGKLTEAVARLRESLAVLAVLRAALSEATAGVGRARSFMPRK